MNKKSLESTLGFAEELIKIRPHLFNFSKKNIYDPFHAEDIVQDTVAILVKKQDEYDPERSFSGWAFKILTFQIKSFLSKSKRNKEIVYASIGEYQSANVNKFAVGGSIDRGNKDLIDLLDLLDPRCCLINKELEKGLKSTIAQIHSIIGEKPSRFLTLYLNGESRAHIMEELNISQPSYYSTKLRLIRKVRTVMGCRA